MRNPTLEEVLPFLRYASVSPHKDTGLNDLKITMEDWLKKIAEQYPLLREALLEANRGPTRPTGKILTEQSPIKEPNIQP